MGNKADLILNYMTDFIKENGYPPTVREICAELDIKSTSTVHRYLKELQAEGRISMGENQNRAISHSENGLGIRPFPKKAPCRPGYGNAGETPSDRRRFRS